MKYKIYSGTDTASICLFDPKALFSSYPEKSDSDMSDTFEKAVKDKNIFVFDTHADGSFIVHIYLEEPLGDDLYKIVREKQEIERFRVPSGVLYCTGLEDVDGDFDSTVSQFPHIKESIIVAPGEYRLTALRMEWENETIRGAMKQSLGSPGYGVYNLFNSYMVFLVLITIVSLFSLFRSSWEFIFSRILPTLMILWTFGITFLRSRYYKRLQSAADEAVLDYPALIVILEKI
jgi:hypothetical protein